MRTIQTVMAEIFMEQQLKDRAAWLMHNARWNFVQHHRRNPAHSAWKKRRASGRS